MATAWMIRSDGKATPCVQHIYANPDDVEETLFAAEWLYEHTRHDASRRLALETIAAWAASLSCARDTLSCMLEAIEQKPYRFLTKEFCVEHIAEMESICTEGLSLIALCKEVTRELNQEFLRARYGGIYHTDPASKEMFFRISTIGFDWYAIIHNFVSMAAFPIERVTIVRDEESTSAENKVYLRLPVEAFMEAQPVRLTVSRKIRGGLMAREIFAHLADGNSVRSILGDLAINSEQLEDELQLMSHWENSRPMELSEDTAAEGIFTRGEPDGRRGRTGEAKPVK